MAKIKIKLGNIEFSGTGEPDWVSEQLGIFLDRVEEIPVSDIQPVNNPTSGSATGETANENQTQVSSLKRHLEERGALKNQNDRFLATADWLRRKGVTELTSSAISKALKENQQSRLGNASDCLNQNVGKGFCEKDGKTFFITPEGFEHLGYS